MTWYAIRTGKSNNICYTVWWARRRPGPSPGIGRGGGAGKWARRSAVAARAPMSHTWPDLPWKIPQYIAVIVDFILYKYYVAVWSIFYFFYLIIERSAKWHLVAFIRKSKTYFLVTICRDWSMHVARRYTKSSCELCNILHLLGYFHSKNVYLIRTGLAVSLAEADDVWGTPRAWLVINLTRLNTE